MSDLYPVDGGAFGCPHHHQVHYHADPGLALATWSCEGLERMAARRAAPRVIETVRRIAIPEGDDGYIDYEIDIAIALAQAVEQKRPAAAKRLQEAIDAGDFLAIEDAIEDINRDMSSVFSLSQAVVIAALASALFSGERAIAQGALADVPSVNAVLDGMVGAAGYYTNQFFNTQVMPALQAEIQNIIAGTGAMDATVFHSLQGVLNDRLKSVPYWRVVANAAASRSYHYGLLKASQMSGLTGYRFQAVLDERTSDICQELDGREWFIADAVAIAERSALAESPEEVKTLQPWPKAADVQGKSSADLLAMGVIMPPLHGHCRSTIVPF